MAAQDLCETHGSTLCLSYSIALLPVFVSRSYYQLGDHDNAMKALEPLESIRDEWDKCIHEYATRAFETKDEDDTRLMSVHDRDVGMCNHVSACIESQRRFTRRRGRYDMSPLRPFRHITERK